MPDNRMFATVLLSALLLFVGATASAQAPTPCKRPPAAARAAGSTLVLNETTKFPCEIRYVKTGVVLQQSPDGKGEDIGEEVVRLPDGRYLGSPAHNAEIYVWNRDGTFLQALGRAGRGPGEFATGPKAIRLHDSGRIYIADNSLRWSIFDASLKLVGTRPAASTGTGFINSTVVLDDATVLTSFSGGEKSFHVYDFNRSDTPVPPLVREFGPPNTSALGAMRLSYRGGKAFWAAPPTRLGAAYVLELWSTDGTLLRTVRRNVPWVPAATATTDASVVVLHEPEDGLLFVAISIRKKEFFALSRPEKFNFTPGGPADRSIDSYFEVIDVRAGVVLASRGPIPWLTDALERPIQFFHNSRQGVQRSEDENGFPRVSISEVQLVVHK